MGAIMIDNWSIESSINFIKNNCHSKNLEGAWINFLTAIIFWDEVWYYQHSLSEFWQSAMDDAMKEKRFNKSLTYIKEILSNVNLDNDIINEIVGVHKASPYDTAHPDYRILVNDDDSEKESTILKRTNFYLLLSNALGVSYLSHPERLINQQRFINYLFNRLELFKQIDKELLEYYSYINNKLEREFLRFQYPVLYDFIRYNSDDVCNQLETALSLRDDKDIIAFRNEVHEIEQIINRGDTQTLLAQFEIISEIAKDITCKYKEQVKIGELSLGLSPALSFPISVKRNNTMRIHTTFFKKLLDFGVNKRPLF